MGVNVGILLRMAFTNTVSPGLYGDLSFSLYCDIPLSKDCSCFWKEPKLLLFSHSGISDSLQSHGLQHARLPCPSPSPRTGSNSCPLSRWCHPIISSSFGPFASCLPSFTASGSFPISRLFRSRGQVLEFQISISPSNEDSELISFGIDWFDLLAFQGTRKSLLQHHSSNTSVLWHSDFFMVQSSHLYMTWKIIALTLQTFVGKVMSLLFKMLSRYVRPFLPSSRCLLISWLHPHLQ